MNYAYAERPEQEPWVSDETYTDQPEALPTMTTAVLGAGLVLTVLVKHYSAAWEALPGHMTQLDLGEWQLTDRPWRLPHTFTLQAVKPG